MYTGFWLLLTAIERLDIFQMHAFQFQNENTSKYFLKLINFLHYQRYSTTILIIKIVFFFFYRRLYIPRKIKKRI